MTPEEQAREQRTVLWIRRATCDAIDQIIAELLEVRHQLTLLPAEPRPDPVDQLQPPEDP